MPPRFLEILIYRPSRIGAPLYLEFLSEVQEAFYGKVTLTLQKISMKDWPEKKWVISNLLEMQTYVDRKQLAKSLREAQDDTTAKVGTYLHKALEAKSLKEAIPSFEALMQLLPKHMTHSAIQILFGKPFEPFCVDTRVYKQDPSFVRRLTFNGINKVFEHRHLMIGVYHRALQFGGKGTVPYLLAYDMKTEKLVWGIPMAIDQTLDFSLSTNQTFASFGPTTMRIAENHIRWVEGWMAMLFDYEKRVCLINPDTGDTTRTLILPYKCKIAELHLPSATFCYQLVTIKGERTLVRSQIKESKWDCVLRENVPYGLFLPLSTHVGISDHPECKLHVFGPLCGPVTIGNYLDAQAIGDTLYMMEKDPLNKGRCFLTVRKLTNDQTVVSEVTKKIALPMKYASLEKLCVNGQWVLFRSNGFSGSLAIFVDLHKEEVVVSSHNIPIYAKTIISESGEVWSWDETSKQIWKISAKGVVDMGYLTGGRGMTFLHVDGGGNLYLT